MKSLRLRLWSAQFQDWSSQNLYLATVLIVAITARVYWELWRGDYSIWWSVDGYPTLVASHLLATGKELSIYHTELWLAKMGNPDWHRMLAELKIIPSGTSFVYHPVYLFVVAPLLGHIGFEAFIALWLVVNAMSIGIIAAELFVLTGVPPGRRRWLLALCVATSFPSMYGAYLGQNIAPAIALLLMATRLIWAGRWLIAVPGLVFAVAMKIWLLPLALLVALLGGAWPLVMTVSALILGLWVIPWWLNPLLMERYLDVVANFSEVAVVAFNNVSIRAMFWRFVDARWVADSHAWFASVPPFEIRLLGFLFAGCVGGVALAAMAVFRPRRPAIFASASAMVLLLPGVVWTHYFLASLPVVLVLASTRHVASRVVGWSGLACLCMPWHSMPGAAYPWPTAETVARFPSLAQGLLAAPLLLSAFGALMVLVAGESRMQDADLR